MNSLDITFGIVKKSQIKYMGKEFGSWVLG